MSASPWPGLQLLHDRTLQSRPCRLRSNPFTVVTPTVHEQNDDDLRIDAALFGVPDLAQFAFLFCLEAQLGDVVKHHGHIHDCSGVLEHQIKVRSRYLSAEARPRVRFTVAQLAGTAPGPSEILRHPAVRRLHNPDDLKVRLTPLPRPWNLNAVHAPTSALDKTASPWPSR